MNDESRVVGLLFRADWTRLCLRAEANDGSTLLLAPGRRYREETRGVIKGCDGDRPWELFRGHAGPPDAGGQVHLVGGPEPPLPLLLHPAWLLTRWRLEPRGRVTACGRDGILILATKRGGGMTGTFPAFMTGTFPALFGHGRAEVVVDAELGILLRVTRMADGEPPDVTELVSLELDPVIDPDRFIAPPGSVIGETWSESLRSGGPVWQVWKTAAGLAAGGLGTLIRYGPSGPSRPAADPDDPEARMPDDDPAPDLSADGVPAGPAVSDEVLLLLQRGGSGHFSATLHEWLDVDGMLARVPEAVRRTGFGGVGLLVSALRERAGVLHSVSALRIGGSGQYQIDHARPPRHGPKTVACDGQRRWQVYADKVTVGRVRPSPPDTADLADPSWLLECRLSGGTLVMAGDRHAYRLNVARGDVPWSLALLLFRTGVAVVDAELGILLSVTLFADGKPMQRRELRDITAAAGDFSVDIPAGLPTEEECDPWEGCARPPGPITPLSAARFVAHEVGTQAARTARKFLRRFDIRQPPE